MKQFTRNRTAYTGWLAAALVVGVFAGTGFQESSKLGVVDLGLVITESKLQSEGAARIQSADAVRREILEYMDIQKIMTRAQCARKRELELKEDRSEQEDAEIEAIKTAVTNAIHDYDYLVTLQRPLTPEETIRLNDYNERKDSTVVLLNEWLREFDQELQALVQTVDREMVVSAKAAAQAVAKQDGYTLVYSAAAAVYAANDITDKAIVEANK